MTRDAYGLGSGRDPHSESAGYRIKTYQDAIERARDLIAGGSAQGDNRAVRQAVLDAYDDLIRAHDWQYFYQVHRLQVYAPVSGTCSYTSSTRLFTIDSGTWPEWATAGASIQVGDVVYLIRSQPSSTTLLADTVQCPADDIDTGTAFTVARQYYRLPNDFRALHRPLNEQGDGFWDNYVPVDVWGARQRYSLSSGDPVVWTVLGDPYETGRMALAVWPTFDTDRTIDFVMQRWPRPLIYDGFATFCRTGTVTTSSAAVTGTSTAFEANMAGAVLRIARSTAASPPDGQGGNNPFERQAFIDADATINSTSMTMTASWSVSSRYYTISDPLDLSPAMLEAFWRCIDWKLGQRLKLKDRPVTERDYLLALDKAKADDQPNREPRSCYDNPYAGRRVSAVQGADDF